MAWRYPRRRRLEECQAGFELNEIEQDMIRKHMFPLESSPAEISGELDSMYGG